MKITIELFAGPTHRKLVTRDDIDKNIEVLARAIANKSQAGDFVLLADTKSILEAIKDELPNISDDDNIPL